MCVNYRESYQDLDGNQYNPDDRRDVQRKVRRHGVHHEHSDVHHDVHERPQYPSDVRRCYFSDINRYYDVRHVPPDTSYEPRHVEDGQGGRGQNADPRREYREAGDEDRKLSTSSVEDEEGDYDAGYVAHDVVLGDPFRLVLGHGHGRVFLEQLGYGWGWPSELHAIGDHSQGR